jgi:hypothetical protein
MDAFRDSLNFGMSLGYRQPNGSLSGTMEMECLLKCTRKKMYMFPN